MDTHRAQTLAALETFIEHQKTLLAQQQHDIERLQLLREKAAKDRAAFVDNLSVELDDRAFRLSEQTELRLKLPDTWSWSAFQNTDTTALRTLATQLKSKQHALTNPSPHQRPSTFSDLQLFVRQAKRRLYDPFLVRFEAFCASSDLFAPTPTSADGDVEEETELDKERRRKELERAKIRELKRRQIRAGGLTLPSDSWLGERGVYIRRDVEDETEEVDVGVGEDQGDEDMVGEEAGNGSASGGGVDNPALSSYQTPVLVPVPQTKTQTKSKSRAASSAVPSASSKPLRSRASAATTSTFTSNTSTTKKKQPPPEINTRPSKRLKLQSSSHPPPPPSLALSSSTPPEDDHPAQDVYMRTGYQHQDDGDDFYVDGDRDGEGDETFPPSTSASTNAKTTTTTKGKTKKDKPKPETYKQAWSASEQNLLEQLLEQIPEGEKFRWQKISKAMGGRRTPRQVASRVQKYFEKLKKYGIEAN